MNCFNHHDVVALGFCCACAKGLCSECIHMHEEKLCCKNEVCQKRLSMANTLHDRSAKLYGIGEPPRKSRYMRSFLLIIMGLLFMLLGGHFFWAYQAFFGGVFMAIGFAMGLFGFSTYLKAKKYGGNYW